MYNYLKIEEIKTSLTKSPEKLELSINSQNPKLKY